MEKEEQGTLPFAHLVLEFPEPSGHYAHANLHEYRNAWPSSIGMGDNLDRNTQEGGSGPVERGAPARSDLLPIGIRM